MTISSENRKAGPFVGNDVTTDFPFAFKVFGTSDLYVVHADSSGAETLLELTTDYTVSLNADQNATPGGTVTLLAALATGKTLTLTSSLQYLQPTDLTNQGGFYPSVVTAALDRLTIFCQQLSERIGRAALVPLSSTSATRANKVIGFDSAGDPALVAPVDNTLLAVDLANSSDASKGAGILGFNNSLAYAVGTVGRKLYDMLRRLDIVGVVEGPCQTVTNGIRSAYTEYFRSGYTARGSVGALGAFEMNVSFNMDYATGVHRLYDQSIAAHWIAMNENGVYLQYAPATTAAGDVWDAAGRPYNWYSLANGNMYARGNAGFGADPIAAARVYAKGSTNTSAAFGFYATNSDGTECFKQYNNGQLFNVGNVGFGAAPLASGRLYLKGETSDATAYTLYCTSAAGTETMTVKNDGTFNAVGVYNATTASAANVFVDSAGKLQRSTSALKYKRDVRDIESVDLSKLRPVRYKSRIEADGDRDFIGFIADEANESGMKELVFYGESGEVEGFFYDRVTALLWKKCQELEQRVSELEAK